MRHKKPIGTTTTADVPPRPTCAQCEKPARVCVQLAVRELELSTPYPGDRGGIIWTPSYRTVRAEVTLLLCDACTSAATQIETRITHTSEAKASE